MDFVDFDVEEIFFIGSKLVMLIVQNKYDDFVELYRQFPNRRFLKEVIFMVIALKYRHTIYLKFLFEEEDWLNIPHAVLNYINSQPVLENHFIENYEHFINCAFWEDVRIDCFKYLWNEYAKEKNTTQLERLFNNITRFKNSLIKIQRFAREIVYRPQSRLVSKLKDMFDQMKDKL